LSNISGFVQSPEKNGAVDVYADGEYVMTLSEDTVIEAGLKIGMALDEKALETVERARQLIKARGKAYNYLSYGDMSVKTMLTKLARAGISDDVALDTVDILCEQGYLDDMRYACALASYLANTKCYGPRRIAQELFVKGIVEDNITASCKKYNIHFSVWMTSLFFFVLHMGYDLPMMFGAAVLCAVTGYVYEKTKSVYGSILLHFVVGFVPTMIGIIA
jgi:hypothetical protein